MLHVDDLTIPVVAPLVYRDVAPGVGEVRQSVRIRPTVTVNVAPSFIVMPAHIAEAPEVTVRLQSHHAEHGCLLISRADGLEAQELSEFVLDANDPRILNQKLPIDLSFNGRRTFEVEWRRSGSWNPTQLSA